MTLVIRRDVQSARSGLANSRNPASPTPSAQRTGAPTARSRSSRTTSSSGAACFACHAATDPAGPAPTTRTSTSGIGNHRKRSNGAGTDALLAAGAGFAIDGQDVRLEVDRLRWTQRKAQAATVAHGEVNHSNCLWRDATHGGTVLISQKAVNLEAQVLLEVTLTDTFATRCQQNSFSFPLYSSFALR